MSDGVYVVPAVAWRDGRAETIEESVADEVAVALEVNGLSHAVMMATPLDLEDFALGFLLSEGLIDEPGELLEAEPQLAQEGITLQLRVTQRQLQRFKERRRSMVGRTGCGICGSESLDQVLRPLSRPVSTSSVAADAISRGMAGLVQGQQLQRRTGSTHAAAWCDLQGQTLCVREDVGRHNALDKLIGAMARAQLDPACGFVVVTSRASYEMVHKTAQAGIGLLGAISAPSYLAIRTAEQAGLTLAGFVRGGCATLYTHPQRVLQVAAGSASR